MNRSEIFLVMVGGMATVAGSVLGAYIGFLGGNDPIKKLEFAKSLLAASVMAAPGAIVIAKMIYPQNEQISNDVKVSENKIGSNLLSAISILYASIATSWDADANATIIDIYAKKMRSLSGCRKDI